MNNHIWRSVVLLAALLSVSTIAFCGASDRRRVTTPSSYSVSVGAGWNLLCVPVKLPDSLVTSVYSTSVSPAYAFQAGYVERDSLQPGTGYWVKFNTAQTISVEGDSLFALSIPVKAGWNMIGGISVPVPTTLVYSEPQGIIASNCYRFAPGSGYLQDDTLRPGLGYWLKVSQDGVVYLNQPGDPTSTFSDSLRSIIFDSLSVHINALPRIDRKADNLTLLAYLRTIPQFVASDTLRGSVWARFTDGRMFVRTNNFLVAPSDTGAGPAAASPPVAPDGIMSTNDNLPDHPSAWVANALGYYFYNLNGGGVEATKNDIRRYVTSVGYVLDQKEGASVGDLRNVSDVGLFYLSAHGGFSVASSGTIFCCIYTSTQRNEYFDKQFKYDLDHDILVYYSAPNSLASNGDAIDEIHYAITANFVGRYMDFGKRASVFLNACSSLDDDMIAAFDAKGADLYEGWTGPVNGVVALRAARHYFDRVLGTNMYFPENPPQRPFDADLAWESLIQKGYDLSPQDDGLTKFAIDPPTHQQTNLLAPSILQAYPDPIPGQDNFYIDGLFGEDPGTNGATILVGGSSVHLREWMSTTKLRLDQPTHGGDVVVTVRGIKSNTTQYSEWHAVFDYTALGRGSLKKHIVFNVNFLADMHRFRINIASAPIFGPGPRLIQILNTSTATFECSGEYKNPDDTTFVEEFWTGSGTVPLGNVSPGFSFATSLQDLGQSFYAQLGFSAEFNNTGNAEQLGIDGGLGDLTLVLNSAYAIAAGSNSYSDGGDNTAEIFWQDIVPLYKPDPNGAR